MPLKAGVRAFVSRKRAGKVSRKRKFRLGSKEFQFTSKKSSSLKEVTNIRKAVICGGSVRKKQLL